LTNRRANQRAQASNLLQRRRRKSPGEGFFGLCCGHGELVAPQDLSHVLSPSQWSFDLRLIVGQLLRTNVAQCLEALRSSLRFCLAQTVQALTRLDVVATVTQGGIQGSLVTLRAQLGLVAEQVRLHVAHGLPHRPGVPLATKATLTGKRSLQRRNHALLDVQGALTANLRNKEAIEKNITSDFEKDQRVKAYRAIQMTGKIPPEIQAGYDRAVSERDRLINSRTRNINATIDRLETQLYGAPVGGAASAGAITMDDVRTTAAKSGKTVQQVIEQAKAKGYSITGQ